MAAKTNIIANIVGQGVTGVLNVVFVPLYIHFIGIEAYGLIGLFTVLQVWLTLLDVGMSPTLSREMARYTAGSIGAREIGDLLYSVTWLCVGLAVVIAGSLAFASDFIASSWLNARTLSHDEVRHALIAMALVIGLRFVEGVQRSALIGLQHQVWLNVLIVSMAVLRAGGALAILTLVSPTVQAYMLWQAAISLLSLVAIVAKLGAVLPKLPERRHFSRKALLDVRAFAGGMFGITLLAILLTQVDKLLLSRLLPLDQFGYYMLASSVTSMLYLIAAPVTQAIYPVFVKLSESRETATLTDRYHAASQLVAVLLAPAALILMLFPHTVLLAWSNDSHLAGQTAALLSLLALGCFSNALMYVPHQLQLAHGWTSLSLRFNFVAVVLLVPAVLIAVPHYGPAAAAIIFVVLNVGYMLLQMPLMNLRILPGQLRRWYVLDIGLPVTAAGMVVFGTRALVGDTTADRFSGLAILVASGLVASAAAAFAAGELRGMGIRWFAAQATRAGRLR